MPIRRTDVDLPTSTAAEFRIDRLACSDQASDSFDRMVEHGPFFRVELNFNDSLDATFTDNCRYSYIKIVDTIDPPDARGAWKDPFLVEQVRFGHRDCRCRGCNKGGHGFHQPDNLGPTVACALNDFADAF